MTVAYVGGRRWDPMEDIEESSFGLTPYWSVDDIENDKKNLDWLKKSIDVCQNYYRDYAAVQMDNLMLYRGFQWLNQERLSNRFYDRDGVRTRRSPKVTLNHLYDITEQWVSRLTRYKPAVKVFPANPEWEDKQDAKVAQMGLDSVWYINRIDQRMQDLARWAKVCGDADLFIEWDPERGDLDPDYVEAVRAAEVAGQKAPRIPVVDENGDPVTGINGEPLFIDKAIHIGDIKYSIPEPWRVWDMPARDPDKVDWVLVWDTEQIDTVRAKYPFAAKDITTDTGDDIFQYYGINFNKLKNETVVWKFYHRKTEFLKNGRYIKFTRNAILEMGDLPYSHGQIPRVRFTDIDVPGEIRGMSCYQQLFPIAHQINACASLIFKALVLFVHPKFMVPAGAADIKQLANESTIVEFNGPVPPQLMSSTALGQDIFRHWEKLEATLDKISGVFTMSRGNAPSGVRAARALRVLEEQEDKRSFATITKFNNKAIVDNAIMTLSVLGDYYPRNPERLLRVVGKGNQHLIRKFSEANLSKPWDVRLEQTTALSQSPAARIEDMLELQTMRFAPDAPFSKEQFYSLLDLTNSEEFVDIATRAVQCAESENEDMMNGTEVPSPTTEEELIVHWRIHRQIMQGREFKEPGVIPDGNKELVRSHMLQTELLMFEKMFGTRDAMGMPAIPGNQAFAMRVQVECPDFPVLFAMAPLPMMAPAGMRMGGMGAPPSEGIPPAGPNPGPMPEANSLPAPSPVEGPGASPLPQGAALQ